MKYSKFIIILILLKISCFGQELIINNTLKMDYSSNIKLEFIKKQLTYNKEREDSIFNNIKYTTRYVYKGIYNNNEFNLIIYFKCKNNVNLQDIIENTKIKSVLSYGQKMGNGNLYEIIIGNEEDYSYLNVNGLKIKKYISPAGGTYTHDILAYYFRFEHDLYDECLIEIYNVWPYKDEKIEPSLLTTSFIEKLQEKNDKIVYLYTLIDNMINNIEIIYNKMEINKLSEEKTFLCIVQNDPKEPVDSFNLRREPIRSNNIIRKLENSELFISLENGKIDIINGLKSNWIKVKTMDGEIGWLFNEYIDIINIYD